MTQEIALNKSLYFNMRLLGDKLGKLPAFVSKLISSGSIRSVAKVISGNVTTNLISLVASILVARWTLPYDMGVWNAAMLVTAYIPVLQLGVFSGLNRELPYLLGKGDKEKALSMAQAAYAWSFILISFSSIVTVIVAVWFWVNGRHNLSYTSIAIGVIVTCSWATYYYTTTYRTHSEFGRLAKNTTAVALIGVGLTLFVFYFGYLGILMRTALFAVFGVAALYYRRPMPVKPLWNKNLLIQMVKIGIPIWLVGQLWTFFISFDRLVLAKSPELLGYFTIAIQVGMFVRNIPIAFTIVLYPQMAQKYGETHNAMAIWHLAKKGAIAASVLGLVAGVCGWLLLPKFVGIMLPKYLPGLPAAQWSSFLGLAMGLYVFDNIYNIIGRQDIYIFNWLIGVLVFYTFWFFLTQGLDRPKIVSAAQAMLFATAAMAVISSLVTHRICAAHDRCMAGKTV